jgi:hypothetical protein
MGRMVEVRTHTWIVTRGMIFEPAMFIFQCVPSGDISSYYRYVSNRGTDFKVQIHLTLFLLFSTFHGAARIRETKFLCRALVADAMRF